MLANNGIELRPVENGYDVVCVANGVTLAGVDYDDCRKRWDAILYLPCGLHARFDTGDEYEIAADAANAVANWFQEFMPQWLAA